MSVASNTSLPQRTLGGTRMLVVSFGDGTTVPTAGTTFQIWNIPHAFRIVSATMGADASGSAVITIGADSYPNVPDFTTDKITASAPPTLSSARNSLDTTLTGWTTTFATGTTLNFELTSVSTCKRVDLTLEIEV